MKCLTSRFQEKYIWLRAVENPSSVSTESSTLQL
ncbi:hypothetical protein SLEP1_g9578 [Rubroshorea leprosula]|uniref:Ycf15 n=1 Tax=Rubroshorea leprosula TaxID=152421 RepID=A0AAV5IF95_9ROSI|nr:hypothetical protein SLEP1_g9578 [Rubroshorea leprosula]